MVRRLRACARLVAVVWHLFSGLVTVQWRFPSLDQRQRNARVCAWAGRFLQLLGLTLRVQGQPQAGPVLLVCNHISWVDIIALHAAGHCRFVAKAELERWPLLSQLVHAAGTLFVARESRRDALRVMHQMAQCLRDGEVLAVFPEGTTSDGQRLLPFHANLLQAAIAVNAPIQPVGLLFLDGVTGAQSLAPAYAGDDTLWQSLWRTVCAPAVEVHLHFGPPQTAMGRDRRTWAADLKQQVAHLRGAKAPDQT